ncbi:MAG: hypothetical protein Q4D21_07525 [Phascolarctobacterium sp.]|nr:hypothetical protein [Phascolarctobacterium sp.]
MTELQKLYEKYKNIEWDELNTRHDEELKEALALISADDIQAIDDAKIYLSILWKFRKHLENTMKYYGDNFKNMLQSLLGVGNDGLYQNKLRFLFELIQNVDDCEYDDINNCNLDIFFDFNKDEIVLNYNEKGFTPFNVFAITGIAEAAKNIIADKVEIGEKGIGFKSVFGIASKVLIQSGYFSFELLKENFTLPNPVYDNFNHIDGTKMTIFLSRGDVNHIFNNITNSYVSDNAIFNRNPILFLNKLTHLRMYNDNSWRNMVFDISREPLDYNGGLQIEHNVKLSVNLGNAAYDKRIKKEILCHRYTLPIFYDKDICKSRYGADTKLTGKRMHVQVLVPADNTVKQISSGALYSFLPTQIGLKIPAVIHAPFKLDASREFVDDQNENKWFVHTYKAVGNLLMGMYKDLATTVKEDIVYYLAPKGSSIINTNFGKTKLLGDLREFKSIEYLKQKIFYTTRDEYHTYNNVTCFPVELDSSVCSILDQEKNWFIPPQNFSSQGLKDIGLKIEQNIADDILYAGVSDEGKSKQAFDYLCDHNLLDKISIAKLKNCELTINQVKSVIEHKDLLKKFNLSSAENIKNSKPVKFIVTGIKSGPVIDFLKENLNEAPFDVRSYFKDIENKCALIENNNDDFFIASNMVIFSKENETDSFINLCDCISPKSMFAALLKTSRFSRDLDKLDKAEITTGEYMSQLIMARKNLKNALGTAQYKNYIDILLNCGSDASRFVNELLQNADDCVYDKDDIPTFTLEAIGKKIVTKYNEAGFERANVRAITAIGESTR